MKNVSDHNYMVKKSLSQFAFLLIVCLSLYNEQAKAQNFNFSDYIPKSPKSPNAAALGQYGDVPVSYYTGVPDIKIPIYEIKVGTVSIPISLSYHASGNKVQDYPSWVGTGWVLNAGGVINRQQRGIIDELMIDNYANNQSNVTTILNNADITSIGDPNAPITASNAMYEYGNNGIGYDTESDIFTCVLPGDNTKFYLDVYGAAHTMPANKLKIQAIGRTYANPNNSFNDGSGLGNNCFQQFVVTDNQGAKYIYGATTSEQAYEAVENSIPTSTPPATINSWFLVEIDLPNGQKINFTYEQAAYQIPQVGDISLMSNGAAAPYTIEESIGSPPSIEKLNGVRLTNITYPGGKIDFISGGYRADLPMDKVLDHINIYNQVNSTYNLLKTYQLVTNNPSNVTPVQLTDMTNAFRLNLQSVVIYNNAHTQIGAYTLTYDQSAPSLPRNAQQDFWGCYSGPLVSPVTYLSNTSPYYLQLSNAPGFGANPAYSQFDILKNITYPTGGYTNFTFENNQAIPNSSTLLNNVGNLISIPTNHSFNFSLENNAAGNASGYSPEFTTGNTITGAIAIINAHELPYDNNTCPNLTQCFSLLLYKKNSDGTYPTQSTMLVNTQSVSLLPYTTYKTQINWQTQNQGNAYVGLNWQEYPILQGGATTPTINVGGLRIKQIQNYDPVTNATITKSYEYLTDAGTCSGSIATLPVYFYYFPVVIVSANSNGYVYAYNLLTSTSQNQSSAFNTAGSEIGYSSVTEYMGNSGTGGKNVYRYTSNDITQSSGYPDVGVPASGSFPFPPVCSYDWRRGKLLSKYSYVNNNGTYLPVSKTDNTYQFFGATNTDANYLLNTSIKIVKNEVANFSSNNVYSIVNSKDFYKYATATEAFYTASTSQQTFDNQSYQNSTVEQTNNTFDHITLKNSSSAASQSNGNVNTQQFQYALDYVNAPSATDNFSLGIKNLIALNLVNAPVEELTIVQNPSGQSFVIGGILFTYYNNKPLINQYYKLTVLAPIALSSFTTSTINSSGQFVFDPRYELISSVDTYTTLYNPSQITKNTKSLTAYQWGYNEQYVVAQVSNAKSSDIFYDSFEEGDSNIAAGTAKTGHYSYNGSYSKTLTGLDPGSYILSYWQMNTSGTWVLQISPATVPAGSSSYPINLSGQIDDVRFYPSAAQMTTYTYDPLIGLTSSTDAKNEITYYEYDNFLRLINIKNKDQNIIKHIDYHYQGQ
jgi:hypothetical protein